MWKDFSLICVHIGTFSYGIPTKEKADAQDYVLPLLLNCTSNGSNRQYLTIMYQYVESMEEKSNLQYGILRMPRMESF